MRRFMVLAFVLAAIGSVGMNAVVGGKADAQAAVTLAVPGGPYSGSVGFPITFNGGGSTGVLTTYVWDFGDGGSASGVVVQHTYLRSGIFAVTLTVIDSVGGRSTTATSATVGVPATGNFIECVPTATGLVCPPVSVPVTTLPTTSCVLTSVGVVCPGGFVNAGFVSPLNAGCFNSFNGIVCPGGFNSGFGFNTGFGFCGANFVGAVCPGAIGTGFGAVNPFFFNNRGFQFFQPTIGTHCTQNGVIVPCTFIRN